MYFISEDERKFLVRKLLPQIRSRGVAEELRGWNWDKPPLSPIYGVKLGIYEVAGKYCSTNRDLYLRRVLAAPAPPNPMMIEGAVLHRTLCDFIVCAKRTIYNCGPNCLEALRLLHPPELSPLQADDMPGVDGIGLSDKVNILWRFEHQRLITRVEEILSRQIRLGTDALVALALPITVEQRLDGTFLGLSPHLSADAFNFAEPMIMDVKFGKPEKFHRLGTTGYAMVMESLYEYPVDIGCIVYGVFRDGALIIERDFHIIDDELRQWFIDERDEKMRIVEEEIDPGLAAVCPHTCPCRKACYPE